jgi:pilus assembly protein CpaD
MQKTAWIENGSDRKIHGVVKRAAALALMTVLLAGCSTLRPTQKAFAPDEYDQRHPIMLAQGMTHLDVFPAGNHLDRIQRRDVVAFARDYTQNGSGGVTIALPKGPEAANHRAILGAVRQALGEGGASKNVRISHFDSDPAQGAAPMRISFSKLQARVQSQCGLWPTDVAGSKDLETWHNRPYHNLGCSYQSMIAAQVADPRDLVRPRSEGEVDLGKRLQDIQAVRTGSDPSTGWGGGSASVAKTQ